MGLRRKFSGEHRICGPLAVTSLYKLLLGDIGREADDTFARHRPHMVMCQSDFRSAVLRGVVTEQQCAFFREYRYLQVTYTIREIS